jgi:hypothetical protein
MEAADRQTQGSRWLTSHALGRELEALSMTPAEHGPTGEHATSGPAAVAGLGATAEALWAKAERAPLLIIAESDNLSSAGDRSVLIDLARYFWAVSVERGRQARVLVLRVCGDASGAVEPFESRLQLEPMSPEETRLMIIGTFGAVRAEPGTFARIHESRVAILHSSGMSWRTLGRATSHVQTVSGPYGKGSALTPARLESSRVSHRCLGTHWAGPAGSLALLCSTTERA